jgi:aminopeptidase N
MTSKSNTKTIYLKDYQPPVYLIKETYLTFELDYQDQISAQENYTRVTSQLHFQRNPQNNSSVNHLNLHGHDFDLLAIALNGRQLNEGEYEKTDSSLLLSNLSDDFILEVQTLLQPQKIPL